MKVVFFGTPSFVDPVLKALQTNFDVVSVFRSPEHLNNKAIAELRNSNADLFIVASFGKILSIEILNIPKYGALNVHPSLLPKYRGPSPIQTTIINGDKKTGVTIIKMDEEVDHGPILFQKEVDIKDTDTFETLAERLFKIGAENLPDTISNYILNKINITPQDDSSATLTKLLNRESGLIDVYNPPDKVTLDHMIRAYFPWPGVWAKYNLGDNKKIIKFLPNEKLQVEGKKPMSYKDFINGYPNSKEILNKLNLI